jgi:hypothetical protein
MCPGAKNFVIGMGKNRQNPRLLYLIRFVHHFDFSQP